MKTRNKVLHCPCCGVLHIDRDNSDEIRIQAAELGIDREGDRAYSYWLDEHEWLNPPHKKHLCLTEDGGCGHIWKPFYYHTNGVADGRAWTPLDLLLWIGLVTMRDDGTIRWPLKIASAWQWKRAIRYPIQWASYEDFFYVFHNLPGVIKWLPGRLLPRRWGFGILGLIEFGDRG